MHHSAWYVNNIVYLLQVQDTWVPKVDGWREDEGNIAQGGQPREGHVTERQTPE